MQVLKLLIVLVGVSSSWAQVDTLWSTMAGVGHESETLYELLELEDGSLIAVGGLFSSDSGRIIDGIYKLSEDGEHIWSRGFHGIGLGWFKGITEADNGDFVLTGQSRIPDQPGETRIFAARVNSSGDSVWTRVYNSLSSSGSEAIHPAVGGGYWIFGHAVEGGQDQFLALKISEAGDSLDAKIYGLERADYLNEVCQTYDGGFMLVGNYWDPVAGHSQGEIIRLDANGDSLWGRLYGGLGDENFYDVVIDESGGYMLCGSFIAEGEEKDDMLIMKIDEDGDSLWSRVYGGAEYDIGSSIVAVPEGFTVLAYTNSFSQGLNDAWILRLDADGDSLFTDLFGSSRNEVVWDMILCRNLGYAFCGFAHIAGAGNDGWILKTTPDPTIETSGSSDDGRLFPSEFSLDAYPNPFNPVTTIRFSLPKSSNASLVVYNIAGQEVATLISGNLTAGSHTITFDGANLTSGVYQYRLSAGELVSTMKMVLLK